MNWKNIIRVNENTYEVRVFNAKNIRFDKKEHINFLNRCLKTYEDEDNFEECIEIKKKIKFIEHGNKK